MFRVQHRQILCGCAGLHHEMRGKTQVPGLAREPQPHDAVTGRVQTLQSNRRGRVHLKPVVDLAQGSAGAGPQADRLGSQPHRFAVGIGGRVVGLGVDPTVVSPGAIWDQPGVLQLSLATGAKAR